MASCRWILALACVGLGCAGDDIAESSSALVGGIPTYDYPAALMLQNPGGGYCTGSLIAPTVVLTAAHCQIEVGGVAMTMDGDQPLSYHGIVDVVFHRRHDGADSFSHHDASLVRLADAPPVDPLPLRVDPLPDVVGWELTVVGFGVVDGTVQNGGGLKRRATFAIDLMNQDYLRGSAPGISICYGDSGGPAFLTFDEVTTVVGITRSHFNDCTGDSQWTRTDAYAADFIVPFVDAWDGPCSFDGDCVTEGCRTPDPDCAPCGVDGICSSGCSTVDLDCPLGELFGGVCASNDDCESRLCIETDDQPGYCSEYCAGAESTCPQNSACEELGDRWSCVLAGDVEPPDSDAGGCAAAGTGGPASVIVMMLLLAGLAARKRRGRFVGARAQR